MLLQVASSVMCAATILGLAVLLAEFTSKMNAVNGIPVCSSTMPHCAYQVYCTTETSKGIGQRVQDASTKRFQRKTVSIWNIAVGGVCLVLMSGILTAFAWRVGQARWQNKSWWACHRPLVSLLLQVAATCCCYMLLPSC